MRYDASYTDLTIQSPLSDNDRSVLAFSMAAEVTSEPLSILATSITRSSGDSLAMVVDVLPDTVSVIFDTR